MYDASDIEEIVEASVYDIEISRYTDIIATKRYDGQNGSVEKDDLFDYWRDGIHCNKMHTDEVLALADVVGEERTMSELIESNAFLCLWEWYDGDPEEEKGKSSEEWLNNVREDVADDSLSDYDTYFYITDNRLGLVTFVSRYYTCIEAEFPELGIIGF